MKKNTICTALMLADKGAGHPSNFVCMLAYFGLTLASSECLKDGELPYNAFCVLCKIYCFFRR